VRGLGSWDAASPRPSRTSCDRQPLLTLAELSEAAQPAGRTTAPRSPCARVGRRETELPKRDRHPARGPSAVRDRVLLFHAVLPECSATWSLTGRLEERVVAEAAGAAQLAGDTPASRSASQHEPHATGRRWIREPEGEDAHVARAAPIHGHAGQLAQQLRVVVRVRGVGPGVSAGPHPGRTVERLDLDARIVRERRQPRRAGGEPRLDGSVGLEGQAVLDGLTDDAQLVERDELGAVELEQLTQLPQLVGGARRDDDARVRPGPRFLPAQRRTVAMADACASKSFARPASARSSSDPTRARSNGNPSAVPCSSM
jgi:hypothetical protein